MPSDDVLTYTPPVALTIAGSDSGGGAGIAADLHTFSAYRVFGTLAITAVTAQNTEKVHDVVAFEAPFVESQIDAVLGDFAVRSVKTGMLATIAIVDAITRRAAHGDLPNLVVDPVMVASSGASLLEGDGRSAYRRLLQHAVVVTPNLPEAEVLVGKEIRNRRAMADAARELFDLGVALVVVKGGHLDEHDATDIVFDGSEIIELSEARIATSNIHGTGCTMSAAIAANLALGAAGFDAVVDAKRYVTAAIKKSASWAIGGGPGPISHFPT